MNKNCFVKIVCIDGPHGVGKTYNLESLRKNVDLIEFAVYVDEGFVPKVKTKFHPQSLFEETKWALNWFENITKRCFFNKKTGRFEHNKIIVTDRSPYSACVYSKSHAKELKKVIDGIRDEFEVKGIKLYNLYLYADVMLIEGRIKERLRLPTEQWRKKLNEDDPTWLKEVIKRYVKISTCFCERIPTDDSEKCCEKIVEFVKKLFSYFYLLMALILHKKKNEKKML